MIDHCHDIDDLHAKDSYGAHLVFFAIDLLVEIFFSFYDALNILYAFYGFHDVGFLMRFWCSVLMRDMFEMTSFIVP